jgi:hypothetical protein
MKDQHVSQFSTGYPAPCPAVMAYPQGPEVPFDTVYQISCYKERGHDGPHEGRSGDSAIIVWGLDSHYAEGQRQHIAKLEWMLATVYERWHALGDFPLREELETEWDNTT